MRARAGGVKRFSECVAADAYELEQGEKLTAV